MGRPFCFHVNSLTASNSCSREVPIVVSMALVSFWRRHAGVDMLAAGRVVEELLAMLSIVVVVIDELSWKLWLYMLLVADVPALPCQSVYWSVRFWASLFFPTHYSSQF